MWFIQYNWFAEFYFSYFMEKYSIHFYISFDSFVWYLGKLFVICDTFINVHLSHRPSDTFRLSYWHYSSFDRKNIKENRTNNNLWEVHLKWFPVIPLSHNDYASAFNVYFSVDLSARIKDCGELNRETK